MDFERDFLETVADTVKQLGVRGKTPRDFTYKEETIRGWSIAINDHDSTKGNPSSGGFWEEYWDRGYWVLRDDGTFWDCGFWASESSRGKERSEWMRPIPISHFVGNQGQPFSAWKAKLERLPYQ